MSVKIYNRIHHGLQITEEAIMQNKMKAEVYNELLEFLTDEQFSSEWRPDGKGGYICSNCSFSYNAGDPGAVFSFCPGCGDHMVAAIPKDNEVMNKTVETSGPNEGGYTFE